MAYLLAQAEAAAAPGSQLASQARYRLVFVERDARRARGDRVDDLHDVKTLIPMLDETWPDAQFYSQFVSVGLSALKDRDLDREQCDEIAQAVLKAWQRLRIEGDITDLVYAYSSFVARDTYAWRPERRRELWQAAWEFSHALANPDGSLACLLDDELIKMEKDKVEDKATLHARRQRLLSDSVVRGQDNAEVVLRFAEFAATEDEAARRRIALVARALSASDNPVTRSMALHALAIVAIKPEERVEHLRIALPAYEQSMTSRDDWLTRGLYWKRALHELRKLTPGETSSLDKHLARAGQRFKA